MNHLDNVPEGVDRFNPPWLDDEITEDYFEEIDDEDEEYEEDEEELLDINLD